MDHAFIMTKRLSINSIVPSILTLFSCCAGLTALRYALNDEIAHALSFVLMAAILDVLDGTVARWLKVTSHFGGELDSLADFVAFGVSPGLIIYYTVIDHVIGIWGWLTTLIFILCCGLRLARFNVSNFIITNNIKMRGITSEPYFHGAPAPSGGILVLAPLAFTLERPEISGLPEWSIAYAVWQVLIGLLMVSTIPSFSLKKIRFERYYRLWGILLTTSLLIIILNQPWWMWVILSLIYMISLPFSLWCSQCKTRRKNSG